MFENELGIIGTGNMGSALLKTILSKNLISEKNLSIYDKDKTVTEELSAQLNVKVAKNSAELARSSRHVLLAVKPQVIDNVLDEIGSHLTTNHTLISIAAGISLDHLSKFCNKDVGIIRIMTNTPLMVGTGASAIAQNNKVDNNSIEFIKKIFNSGGVVHIDAVTGLSGSGPAYIFVIIEALADGGVKMGLSRKIAIKLAAQTALGAAKLILETGMHPGELKDMVASPGGTTITALHELEKAGLRATLIRAVEVATEKSRALNSD